MPESIPNVVLFGESGSGKSSIVNLLAGRELATVSSNITGCTFTSSRYPVAFNGKTFNIYDTAGLDEGDNGTVPKQDAIIQLFSLLKSLDTGVNLLVFCVRGKIKEGTHKNWRLFHDIICQGKVPTVIAITGLEQEAVMNDWWWRNKGAFQKYEIYPQGHACITATRGKALKSGRHQLDEEYEESQVTMRNVLVDCALDRAWRVERVEWFRDIVEVSYESRCFKTVEHRNVVTVAGEAITALKERCEMSDDEAHKLAAALSRV